MMMDPPTTSALTDEEQNDDHEERLVQLAAWAWPIAASFWPNPGERPCGLLVWNA